MLLNNLGIMKVFVIYFPLSGQPIPPPTTVLLGPLPLTVIHIQVLVTMVPNPQYGPPSLSLP